MSNRIADALGLALSFMEGFEDDDIQEGMSTILATVRAAKREADAMPDMVAALKFARNELSGSPRPHMVRQAIKKANDALAKAEA